MNILISSASYNFSDHLAGGENRVVFGIVKELDRRGHRLFLFAPKCDVQAVLPNTRLYELGRYRFDPDRDYFRYRIDWWLYNLRAYVEARRLLWKERIDIVHHIRPAFQGRFSLASLLPLPFVYGPITPAWENTSEHDRDIFPIAGRTISIWRRVASRVFHRFEKTVVPRIWRATLLRAAVILVQIPKALQGIPKTLHSKTEIVGLGTDTRQFCPSTEQFERPTILFLAKLFRRKGLEYLLKAMSQTISVVPGVRLKIVGDGPARSYFQDLTTSLKLESYVEFIGSVPHGDTVYYFQRSHIYCLPSVGEPAANTLLEAMACGIPVVSTASGGVPNFVKDGKSGILVPPRNSRALADALCRLLTDPILSKKMGNYNRKLSEETHDIRRLADRIEAAYGRACGLPD